MDLGEGGRLCYWSRLPKVKKGHSTLRLWFFATKDQDKIDFNQRHGSPAIYPPNRFPQKTPRRLLSTPNRSPKESKHLRLRKNLLSIRVTHRLGRKRRHVGDDLHRGLEMRCWERGLGEATLGFQQLLSC